MSDQSAHHLHEALTSLQNGETRPYDLDPHGALVGRLSGALRSLGYEVRKVGRDKEIANACAMVCENRAAASHLYAEMEGVGQEKSDEAEACANAVRKGWRKHI